MVLSNPLQHRFAAGEPWTVSARPEDQSWVERTAAQMNHVLAHGPWIDITGIDRLLSRGSSTSAAAEPRPMPMSPPWNSYILTRSEPEGDIGMAIVAIDRETDADGLDDLRGMVHYDCPWEEVRWLLMFHVIAAPRHGTPHLPDVTLTACVRRDGLAASPRCRCMVSAMPSVRDRVERDMDEGRLYCSREIIRAIEAHQLLHCRDISLRERELSPRLSRQLSRRLGVPEQIHRHHTLILRLPARRGSRSDADQEIDLGEYRHRPLPEHLVRGNFAYYTADAPLFGRITGSIWRPPHTRGDIENGKITKDYRIDGAKQPHRRDGAG